MVAIASAPGPENRFSSYFDSEEERWLSQEAAAAEFEAIEATEAEARQHMLDTTISAREYELSRQVEMLAETITEMQIEAVETDQWCESAWSEIERLRTRLERLETRIFG